LSTSSGQNASISTNEPQQLRMRVFAGPNGSGKSTVINDVRNARTNGRAIDFGYYVNADEIAQELRQNRFSFTPFDFTTDRNEFEQIALDSGLVNEEFPPGTFRLSFTFRANSVRLKLPAAVDRLAQIIADFLRKKLLQLRRKFSFETVFSHESKIDIMREAAAVGYKVYLYFVATESDEINKFRVKARVEKGGHDVPEHKIEKRYKRSLELLYDACQSAYQVFFFDNSVDGRGSLMFAHFKILKGAKQWDASDPDTWPEWFFRYYVNRISK